MRVVRLIGVIDRVVNGVAAIVPNDRSRELYLSAKEIVGAREGMEVDLLIIPGKDPNDLCRLLSKKGEKFKRQVKRKSYCSLLRAMGKALFELRSALRSLEIEENPNNDEIEKVSEKISFLEKGLALFKDS